MNLLAKVGTAILTTLLVLFFAIISLPISDTTYKNHLIETSRLINLPALSLSTSFDESRVLEYEDYSNLFILEIKKDDYMGFVYVK